VKLSSEIASDREVDKAWPRTKMVESVARAQGIEMLAGKTRIENHSLQSGAVSLVPYVTLPTTCGTTRGLSSKGFGWPELTESGRGVPNSSSIF
jgi:hypothetical protein